MMCEDIENVEIGQVGDVGVLELLGLLEQAAKKQYKTNTYIESNCITQIELAIAMCPECKGLRV